MENIQSKKRRQTETICHNCNKIFLKDVSEINRNKKVGRNNYCSHQCCGSSTFSNLLDENGNIKNFVPYLDGRSKDELSDFRPHLKNIKRRHFDYNISLFYLKELWESQNGVCPYTGVKLKPYIWNGNPDHIFTASLDRIDSSKGYIIGNVQFVSMAANHMKSSMTHEQTVELCRIIANHWKQ